MTLQADAQAALTASDITVLRAVESGTQIPAEWVAYRQVLREIVSTGEGSIPNMPAYPLIAPIP